MPTKLRGRGGYRQAGGVPYSHPEAPGTPQTRDHRAAGAAGLVLALVVLLVVLRWRTLWTGYWGDEAIAIGIASHPLGTLPHYLGDDGSPPLYYVALHFWMEAFGRSEVATHVLSLIPALLAVPVAWWSAARLWGRPAAPMAAALVATCSYFAYYSTETRMYSWLVLMAMVALTFFVLAYQQGELRHWAGAALSMSALLYLQYYGLYFFAATVTAGIALALQERSLARLRATAAFGAACLVMFAPWLPQFVYQLHHTGAPWAPHPTPVDLLVDSFNALASAGWAGVVVAIAIAVLGRRRRRRRDQPPSALLLATMIPVLTLVLAWGAGQLVNSWDPRYLGIATVPALLPLAGALSRARAPWGRVGALVAALAMAATSLPLLVDRGTTVATAKSDARYLVEELEPKLAPGSLVISSEVTDAPAFAFYLGGSYRYATPLGTLLQPLVVDWSNLTSRLQANNAAAELAPLLSTLPVGREVVVVDPASWGGGQTPKAYATAVEDQALAADRFVADDPELREVGIYRVPPHSNPLYPFVATLFVKVTGRP